MHAQDLDLARRIVRGDRAAFETLFEREFPRLYRFVLLRVRGDTDAAQDLCQQTLERAMRRLDSYRGEAALFTWLCQIARNEMADYWERHTRDHRREPSYDQDEGLRRVLDSLAADPASAPESQREDAELRLMVQTVLDHLPTGYGEVLEWKYVEGLAAGEIGHKLGLTATAAHSLLARARRAFRTEFDALAQERP